MTGKHRRRLEVSEPPSNVQLIVSDPDSDSAKNARKLGIPVEIGDPAVSRRSARVLFSEVLRAHGHDTDSTLLDRWYGAE